MSKIINVSIAAAVAALAGGNAFALQPGATIGASVYVGGATAQENGFLLVARTVCQSAGDSLTALNNAPNSRMDVYRISGTGNYVVTCLSNDNLSGVTPGTAVAIYKSGGGSGQGTINVALQQAVSFVAAPAALASCSSGTFVGRVDVGSSRVAASYLDHTGCAGTQTHAPEIGLADVEPTLIDGVTEAHVSLLSTTAINHGIFGFAVSEPLRNALQAGQGLVPCSVSRTDASRELSANQPSLTRAQLAAILTGNINNWNQISVRGSSQGLYDYIVAQNQAACPFPAVVAGGARPFVFRRPASSGTQAITEIWALKQRCESSVAEILGSGLATSADTALPTFTTNSWFQVYNGSSGIRNALDLAAGPWSVQNPSLTEARWAIGNLSCENTWKSASSGGDRAYRFVKIRGALPGLRDVANSSYDFYAEQVVNSNNSVTLPSASQAFLDYVTVNLSDAEVLHVVNAGFPLPGTNIDGVGVVAGDWAQVQGAGCLLGVPNPGVSEPPAAPISAGAITDNPVNTTWKQPLGSTNNCQDPVVLGELGYKTPVGGHDQADIL